MIKRKRKELNELLLVFEKRRFGGEEKKRRASRYTKRGGR